MKLNKYTSSENIDIIISFMKSYQIPVINKFYLKLENYEIQKYFIISDVGKKKKNNSTDKILIT